MSDAVIEIDQVSRMYKRYRHPRYRVMEALGFRIPPKSYDEFWALRDVSLHIGRGERVGIIGRNGAGKSTLLSIVCGRLQPTGGSVRVNGKIQALMELGTGFHPDFSGRQNVLTSLAYQGITGRKAVGLLDEIVEFAELEEFIEQPVKTYSSGMYARLAFATSTVVEPDVLIIDEVLGAGDAYFAAKSTARMRRLAIDTGATVLFVSHDISAVQMLCDRAIWIDRGQVRMEGSTLDVAKSYYAAVLEQEEVRLRARTSRITARLRGGSANVEAETELKILRFAPLAAQELRLAHPVRRVALKLADGRTIEVFPGGAMDNDATQSAYLATDQTETLWSRPIEIDGVTVRQVESTGGSDNQAPLFFQVPVDGLQPPPQVIVEHAASEGEELALEIFDGSLYERIAILKPSPGKWVTEEFALANLDKAGAAVTAEGGDAPAPPQSLTPEAALPNPVEVAAALDALNAEPPAALADSDLASTAVGHPIVDEKWSDAVAETPPPAQDLAAVSPPDAAPEPDAAAPEGTAVEPDAAPTADEAAPMTDSAPPECDITVETMDPPPAIEEPEEAAPPPDAVESVIEDTPPASVAPLRDRWETREARFIEITPCNPNTLITKHIFALGEDIAFRVVAEFRVDLPPLWVVAVMFDQYGSRTTLLSHYLPDVTPTGAHEFLMVLSNPNIRQGEYVLTFELLPELDYNSTERLPYFCHWDRCVFMKVDEDYHGSIDLGLLHLPVNVTHRTLDMDDTAPSFDHARNAR